MAEQIEKLGGNEMLLKCIMKISENYQIPRCHTVSQFYKTRKFQKIQFTINIDQNFDCN